MQELRYWAVASLVLIGLWIAFALWVSATISSNEPPEAVVFVNPGPVLVLAIWTAYFGLAVVIRVHTTTPHLSTGYLASLQLLFRLRAAIKWAVAGAAGTALPVANPNSTPEFQKFAMIRLILKLA